MPTSASEYVGGIKDAVRSFWHGMSITLSYMLRRPITVQYPDRTELPVRDVLPARYRGFLEVDPAICTGCQACERACPISCIEMVLEKDPQNPKQRVVSQFDIDEAKCMYCGLCVEPCPTGSIQHTREFEGSQRSLRNLVFRWADPLAPFPVYKVPKGIEYFPRVPLGALVREMLAQRPWDMPAPQFLPPEPPKPPPPRPAAAPPGAAAKPGPAAPAARPAAPAPAAKPAGERPPPVPKPSGEAPAPVAKPAGEAPASTPKPAGEAPAPAAKPPPAPGPASRPAPPAGAPAADPPDPEGEGER